MATKKPRKPRVVPYNPFKPFGNHSLKYLESQAASRAQNDVNTQVGALPAAKFYTDAASQLANSLAGIQKQQGGLAAAGGGLYQQAFQGATAPVSRAAQVAGGAAPTPTAGAGNLSSTLGALLAGSMGGAQQAAIARGAQDVANRAKQESQIRMTMPQLQQKYLDDMKQQALQAATADMNQQLAQQQFGLQASNTTFDNNLAAAKFADDQANTKATTASKSRAAKSKKRQAKLKEVRGLFDKWTASKKGVVANVYHFQPNIRDANGHLFPGFDITAKDGPSAINQAVAKMTASGVQHITGTQMGTWLQRTTPQQGDIPGMDRRQAYIRGRDILINSGLFTKAEAIRYMREYLGANPHGPLVL